MMKATAHSPPLVHADVKTKSLAMASCPGSSY